MTFKTTATPLVFQVTLAISLIVMLSTLSGCAHVVALSTGPEPVDKQQGKRTLGSMIEDESIETKIKVNLHKAGPGIADSHINVISFNGIVLLVGQVRSEKHKRNAERIAQNVNKVRKVHNEITVAGASSYLGRTNDSWLTTKIKSRMLSKKEFSSTGVKVVTEDGIVYLMGLLTKQQAQDAVDIVQQVHGVQKIVKIIEYTQG